MGSITGSEANSACLQAPGAGPKMDADLRRAPGAALISDAKLGATPDSAPWNQIRRPAGRRTVRCRTSGARQTLPGGAASVPYEYPNNELR